MVNFGEGELSRNPDRDKELSDKAAAWEAGNKEKIQKIADSAEQSFIATAEYVVVVYSDNSRLINLFITMVSPSSEELISGKA